MKKIGVAILFLINLASVYATDSLVARSSHGMVVSAQHLATQVGVNVLKQGGNAVATRPLQM